MSEFQAVSFVLAFTAVFYLYYVGADCVGSSQIVTLFEVIHRVTANLYTGNVDTPPIWVFPVTSDSYPVCTINLTAMHKLRLSEKVTGRFKS